MNLAELKRAELNATAERLFAKKNPGVNFSDMTQSTKDYWLAKAVGSDSVAAKQQ